MKNKIPAWQRHITNLYLLMDDILENLLLQQLSYKFQFVYTFNPDIEFIGTDSSFFSQIKLLNQLQDQGIFDFDLEDISPTIQEYSKQYYSRNSIRYPGKKILLTINPDKFNSKYDEYKKYVVEERQSETNISQITKIGREGHFRVKGYEGIMLFKPPRNSYLLLRIILVNFETRTKLWSFDELEPYLDRPSDLKEPSMFIKNTAYNINTEVKKKLGVNNLLIINNKNMTGKRTISLNDNLV